MHQSHTRVGAARTRLLPRVRAAQARREHTRTPRTQTPRPADKRPACFERAAVCAPPLAARPVWWTGDMRKHARRRPAQPQGAARGWRYGDARRPASPHAPTSYGCMRHGQPHPLIMPHRTLSTAARAHAATCTCMQHAALPPQKGASPNTRRALLRALARKMRGEVLVQRCASSAVARRRALVM